jgi:RNA polymerase sigma-70 factor, ECF subfamily
MHSVDRRLVKKILGGDRHVADAWTRTTYPAVHRFLARLTRSREDAGDLTQQTFLKVREGLPTFRFECPLRCWVYRIAYREYQHWLRSRRSEVELLDRCDRAQELSEDAILLSAALDKLPTSMSEAFWLREVEGLSVLEVAQVLGVPEGTVKSRCHIAKAKLRAALESTYLPTSEQMEIDHAN